MKPFLVMLTMLVAFMLTGVYAVQARRDHPPDGAGATVIGDDAMQLLRADGHYKILVMALEETGVADDLRKQENLTFFAPSDEAFQRVPKLSELLHDDTRLKQVLLNHVVPGDELMFAELAERRHLETSGGRVINVKSDGRNVNDARIEKPNMKAGGAVIHGIDKVLMENNDSKLRQAGETLEEGVKFAGRKTYDGLKTGAGKVKEYFTGEKHEDAEPAAK